MISCGIAPPAFRLPDSTHVGGVNLQVSDLQRSMAYYEEVLGLRVLTRAAGSAILGPDGQPHPFVRLESRPGVVPARRGAFGLYHFAVLLPERAALGRFATHLVTLGIRPGMADHLVSESLYLRDPDGLGIEVYADRRRSTWRQQGRELVMATDPLDIDDLMAAGGNRPWVGMPAATVVGHMHLSVGSLREAEAFYHVGLGLDKMVWSYPGALFLAAGGYHHHLGTNVWAPGPAPLPHEARLLGWELVVPSEDTVSAATQSLRSAGFGAEDTVEGRTLADPWGTRLHLVVPGRSIHVL